MATTPYFIDVSGGLRETVEACWNAGIDILFIDTPPSATSVSSSVIDASDLVIAPVRPSPIDLRSVGSTVALVKKARKLMVFGVTQVTARARIAGQAAIALSQHGTVAPVMISSRVDFASSMTDGRTAGEIDPSSKSAGEIAELWDYLAEKLKELN